MKIRKNKMKYLIIKKKEMKKKGFLKKELKCIVKNNIKNKKKLKLY
jgi:hypothetical protein